MCSMAVRLTRVLFLLAVVSGCSTMNDVLQDKSGGTAKTYAVNADQAWNISKAVFRWGGADAVEEHRDRNYMLTSSGMNLVSYGAVMGAWVDPVDAAHATVTVVTKRRLSINVFTTMREKTFHKMFAQAVEILNNGGDLPDRAPPE